MSLRLSDTPHGLYASLPRNDELQPQGLKRKHRAVEGKPRKRASQACLNCRARKTRCNGEHPTCGTCLDTDKECTYFPLSRKRGTPQYYLKTLEMLWSLTLRLAPGSESTALQILKQTRLLLDNDNNLVILNETLGRLQSHDSEWQASPIRLRIRDMLIQLENGNGMDSPVPEADTNACSRRNDIPGSYDIDPWSHKQSAHEVNGDITRLQVPHNVPLDVADLNSLTWSKSALLTPPSISESSPPHALSHFEPIANISLKPTGSTFSLPQNASVLVHTYLKYSNTALPVVPDHIVANILERAQQSRKCAADETALLWSIFALSEQQKIGNDENSIRTPICRYSAQARSLWLSAPTSSAMYLQVSTLLVMLDIARGEWYEAFSKIGQITRSMLSTYENMRRGSPRSSQRPSGTDLISVVFVLDTLVAAYLENLPHLRTTDIEEHLQLVQHHEYQSALIKSNQTPSGSKPYANIHSQGDPVNMTFTYCSQLAGILNNALCAGLRTKHLGSKHKDLTASLKSWHRGLPSCCVWRSDVPFLQMLHGATPAFANLHLLADLVQRYLRTLELRHSIVDQSQKIGVEESLPGEPPNLYKVVFGIYSFQGLLDLHSRATRDYVQALNAKRVHEFQQAPPQPVSMLTDGRMAFTTSNETEQDTSTEIARDTWPPIKDSVHQTDGQPRVLNTCDTGGADDGSIIVVENFVDPELMLLMFPDETIAE